MSELATPNVVVHCLGSFSLRINGRPVERWRAGKTRHLFHFLLMNRGQVVLKERLQDALWPEAEGDSATSLRVAVHGLRRILSLPSEEEAPMQVQFRDVGYMLQAYDLWVDVEAFAAACDEGSAALANGDRDSAMASYRRAVDLYAGDFLVQDKANWIDEHRQWNRTRLLQVLGMLRDEAVRCNDVDEAIHWCRRTLECDSYHEESFRLLIACHARRGERKQAKLWYELCARRLEELAVLPSAATRAAYTRALNQSREPWDTLPVSV